MTIYDDAPIEPFFYLGHPLPGRKSSIYQSKWGGYPLTPGTLSPCQSGEMDSIQQIWPYDKSNPACERHLCQKKKMRGK